LGVDCKGRGDEGKGEKKLKKPVYLGSYKVLGEKGGKGGGGDGMGVVKGINARPGEGRCIGGVARRHGEPEGRDTKIVKETKGG